MLLTTLRGGILRVYGQRYTFALEPKTVQAYVIAEPILTRKIRTSDISDVNGVCAAIGYEIDDEGEIIGEIDLLDVQAGLTEEHIQQLEALCDADRREGEWD